jgi:predicted Zn-dependent protease
MQLPPREAIGRIRFDPERKLFDALSGDELIAQVAARLRKGNEEETNRRRLLANSLRITDRIIPSLMDRIAHVKRVTHLEETEVETFIYNSPQHSASCMCFENGDVFLLISSGLYTKLTERELLFVIGHEFGHVVYGHHLLPARAILAQRGVCDAERALKLMAWSRRAELSADRVGLLCCQDLDAAATAFIKISSGLSEELVDFDLQGYVSQVADLEAVSRTVRAVEDFYSTHPFNPIRVVAISRFWQSHTLCDLLGHSPAKYSDQAVDARIDELLRFMDPDAATMRNRNVVECLVWGGFWVAASDGRIDQVEVEALSKTVNSQIANQAAVAIQKSTEPLKFIREQFQRAAEGCRHLPAPQRHAIIQQLIAVAKANVTVGAQERRTLHEICIALAVNPAFPEKILSQYADCVFAQLD